RQSARADADGADLPRLRPGQSVAAFAAAAPADALRRVRRFVALSCCIAQRSRALRRPSAKQRWRRAEISCRLPGGDDFPDVGKRGDGVCASCIERVGGPRRKRRRRERLVVFGVETERIRGREVLSLESQPQSFALAIAALGAVVAALSYGFSV